MKAVLGKIKSVQVVVARRKWSQTCPQNMSFVNTEKESPVESRPTSILDLPLHVLVNIFAHFSEQELSSILAPVCRIFRKATKDPSLWKQLEFREDQVTTSTICRMLRCAPKLLTLKLISVPDIITVIRQMCRCNNQLQNVTVKNCTNVKIDERIPESVMRNLILSCKQLRSLNIEGTQFFASRFCQDLVQLAHLRSLNFGTSQCIRVKDMVTLSLCCRELQELKISHRRACDGESVLRDEDASFIFGMLKDSLRSLAFDMCGLGATSYQAIFQCTKLNDLCLNNALNLSSELFRSLADYLPEIRRLTIGNAGQLSSEDFIHLFTSKSDIMSNLTSLKLCGCWRLGDKGLETIVDTCGEKLEQLSARSCKSLTSDSIEYVILKCDKLCHLDIAHIVKLDAVSLGHIAIHLPCLQTLVVDADLKKETWLHQLKSKMPHLKIKRSFSEYCKNEAMFS